MRTVLVAGGAGYAGAVLVPKLLARGYRVKVLDLYLFGNDALASCRSEPGLAEIRGDVRDRALLDREMSGVDAVVHLACISNDPSFDLDPKLGRSVNLDSFAPFVEIARKNGVQRFLFASSSSVYGLKSEPDVTEDLPLAPLTDYSRCKADCESILTEMGTDRFTVTAVRPATLCGDSPRLRLDLTVNILTNHAVHRKRIAVFGGEQKRPNLHVQDMADFYLHLLEQPDERIHRKAFNIGMANYTVREIADRVNRALGGKIPIDVSPSDDKRSYHISSRRAELELGFVARRTVEDAVLDLKKAFDEGRVPDPLDNPLYSNVRRMQSIRMDPR